MKASKFSTNSPQIAHHHHHHHHHKSLDSPDPISTPVTYEPTSVLDPHLTSSPAAAALSQFHPPPPPSSDDDDWDPLSFFLSSEACSHDDPSSFDPLDLPDLDLDLDLPTGSYPLGPPTFDRAHLDLLLKAATAVESNDAATATVILSRLNHVHFGSSPLHRAAFHFKDALLSLLPNVPNPPTATPPASPVEIVARITAHKSFSDLSPLPQFTSFTANQAILESLFLHHPIPSSKSIHLIDFDIGLGGQWSSFAQEIASRCRALRSPPPHIRITAVVPDETVETLLAAENLRDFARAIGVHLSVGFVRVGDLGTLALGRVRLSAGEAVGVVLTPAIFRVVGGQPESTAALLRFVRQASPGIVVFVDTECFGGGGSSYFRRSFASGLEFYSSMLESIDAAAGAEEAAVRRVEEKVVRPRVFGAVAGWAPWEGGWREILAGSGMAPAGFSEFTESQAEWLLRRAPVEGFRVARREGSMVLSWRGRDLAATSAWRC